MELLLEDDVAEGIGAGGPVWRRVVDVDKRASRCDGHMLPHRWAHGAHPALPSGEGVSRRPRLLEEAPVTNDGPAGDRLQHLLDREDIRDCLHRYCRGVVR